MDQPLRIGAVSFLNTVPLIEGLEDDPGIELQRDLPARLADLLWEGRIEAGLVPVVEYLRGTGGELVPGVCIASDGPVRTVKLFSRRPVAELESIAVDRGSRSSVALLRVLLAERFGHHPDLHVVEPRPGHLFTHHEAVLVIGDRAGMVDEEGLEVLDLGEAWREMTGLPFVFAVWALADGLAAERRRALVQKLRASAAYGLARLDELAAREAKLRRLPQDELLSYWRDCIVYDLGERELAGLQRFAELAAAHDLLPGPCAVTVAEA